LVLRLAACDAMTVSVVIAVGVPEYTSWSYQKPFAPSQSGICSNVVAPICRSVVLFMTTSKAAQTVFMVTISSFVEKVVLLRGSVPISMDPVAIVPSISST
jgi:hypothetical protein